jgi:hypothetical protein
MLPHPFSRGGVHIASNDFSKAHIVDPNYLSNPVDIEVLAHHLRYLGTIAASTPFGKVLKQPLQHQDTASMFANLDAANEYL